MEVCLTRSFNAELTGFQYVFYNKDPRRLQPLVDHLVDIWTTMDYNPELAFDTTKLLSVLKGFSETLNWKFNGTQFLTLV